MGGLFRRPSIIEGGRLRLIVPAYPAVLRRGSLKSLDCAREQSVHVGLRRMIDTMHQFKWMPRMGPPGGPTGALRAKARNGRSIRS